MVDTAHSYTGGESEATIGEALSPRPDGVVVATKGGYRARHRQPGGAERADRGEPAAPAHRHDRPLLPAPRRPRDAARGEPRHDRRVPRPRADPARRALGGRHRAARARAPGRPDRGRPEPLQPGGADARRGRRPLRRAGDRVRAVLPAARHRRAGRSREIAARHGATPEQVALAWLLARSPAMLPIPGTLSLEHLEAEPRRARARAERRRARRCSSAEAGAAQVRELARDRFGFGAAAPGTAARRCGGGRGARRPRGAADRRREVGHLRARRAAPARADDRRLAADRAAGRPAGASPGRRPRRDRAQLAPVGRASTRPRWPRPPGPTRSSSSRRSSSPTARRSSAPAAPRRGCSPSTRRT